VARNPGGFDAGQSLCTGDEIAVEGVRPATVKSYGFQVESHDQELAWGRTA
jgi:hypothetical protein